MSGPDDAVPGPLARRDDEPIFDEPWQAQVLALAFTLIERGELGAGLWSEALGAELAAARARGDEDDPQTYYRCVLAALETLLADDGRVTPESVHARTEAWRRAYLDTPHGEPVEL